MYIHNWTMDIHNWIMDIHNIGFMRLWLSIHVALVHPTVQCAWVVVVSGNCFNDNTN